MFASYISGVSSAGTRCLCSGNRLDGRISCQSASGSRACMRVFLSRQSLNLDHFDSIWIWLQVFSCFAVAGWSCRIVLWPYQRVALSPGKVDINIAPLYYKENQLFFSAAFFFYNAVQRKSNEKYIEHTAGLLFHLLAGVFCVKFTNVAQYLLPFGRFGFRRSFFSFKKKHQK